MRVSKDMDRVRHHYVLNKAAGKKNALLKAIVRAFGCEIFLQTLGGITSALLNFMSPFIVLKLVKFIDEGVAGEELTWDSVKPGVILSSALIVSQILSQYIFQIS